jgi:hypothetical protein
MARSIYVLIDVQSYSSLSTAFTEYGSEPNLNYVSKFNRQRLLKHTFFLINLQCSRADFIKKGRFLTNMHFYDLTSFIEKLVRKSINTK